jgi:anti-sigma B factor antagonist
VAAPRQSPAFRELSVSERQDGDAVILSIAGTVDMAAAPPLAEHVREVLRRRPPLTIFDLTDVDFLASAGMSVIMEADRIISEAGASFRVVADGHVTARPMQLMGIDDLLEIYPTLDAALRADPHVTETR